MLCVCASFCFAGGGGVGVRQFFFVVADIATMLEQILQGHAMMVGAYTWFAA